MLNRRHIRIKVMQTIYAMHQSKSDQLEKEEKFLFYSIDSIQDLYLTMLTVLIELKKTESIFLDKSAKKHLSTKEDRNPNQKFINNRLLQMFADNKAISNAVDYRKIDHWQKNNDTILMLLDNIKASKLYQDYMSNGHNNFEDDKTFLIALFADEITTSSILYNYIEDQKLTWIDDVPVVNTLILKQLNSILETHDTDKFRISKLFKDDDDKEFVSNLFRKTILNETELTKEFIDKTPNWDFERIAEIDTIILKMAICEFLKFPSIPTKVTINEYLEIAKEYSTPKSSFFINGILDNVLKENETTGKLQKIGRGLL